MRVFVPNTRIRSSQTCWNRELARALAPRKRPGAPDTPLVGVMEWNLHVLPKGTRPSLFGSD